MRLIPDFGATRVYIEYAPPINYAHCATIQASRDGCKTWRNVPTLSCVPVSSDGLVHAFDYTAPLNSTSWYRALPFRSEGDILRAAPSYSEEASVTFPDADWWLK